MTPWQRLLLHTLLVAAWFLGNGYSFGLVDQVLHLPFLDQARNPGFLSHDYLLGHTSHPSLFWILQVPLVAWFRIEYVYLAMHIASVWALVGGMVALTRALYPGPSEEQAGWLAACLAVVGFLTYGGIPSLDALVLNRTVVLGAELWALGWAVRGRLRAAFVLCGLAFDIHPTTGLHTALLVFAIGVWPRASRRRTVLATPWFLVAALPLLIMMVRGAHGSVPWPAPAEWFSVVSTAYPFHHFFRLISPFQYLCGALPLAVILSARRSQPRPLVDAIVLVSVLACAVHVLVTSALRWPIAIELHLLEITRFLPFLACAATGAMLAASGPWQRSTRGPWLLALAFAAFGACSLNGREDFALWRESIAPTVLLVAAALLPTRVLDNPDATRSRWPWPVIALFCLVLTGLNVVVRPDIRIVVQFPTENTNTGEYEGAWRLPVDEAAGGAVMRWAKTHLPKQSIVATPPYFDHPLTAFRHEAGLAMLGTFKDGGEATFDFGFAKEWKARMIALSGLDDLFAKVDPPGWWWKVNKDIAINGWRWADTTRLRMLATRFGATHAIVETQAHRGSVALPVVYADSAFVVYAIEDRP